MSKPAIKFYTCRVTDKKRIVRGRITFEAQVNVFDKSYDPAAKYAVAEMIVKKIEQFLKEQ